MSATTRIFSMEPTSKPEIQHQPVPDFNRLAKIYRWMEWLSFGPALWRCRCAFLSYLGSPRNAVVLGDGDGRFTARLLREQIHLSVDAVDCSAAMLSELTRRAGSNSSRVHPFVADARPWQPVTPHYDLIATHFFLDCLSNEEVSSLALRLRSRVTINSIWLISEFAIPDSPFGKWLARPLVAFLYWAFKRLTGLTIRRLPNHRNALANAGFRLVRESRYIGGLLVSELWQPCPPSAS